MNILDLLQGFVIGSSLIIAIGPQNLFVINQGIKRKYILITVLICSLSDAILIIIGISLSSILIDINNSLIDFLKILGGIWLIFYGLRKIVNSKNYKINNEISKNQKELRTTIINLLIITYINPHVYIDTVILLGTISSNFDNKFLFGSGAIFASIIFFFFLGYGSKLISNLIINEKLWFWVDNIFGILMLSYGLYFIII